ncbi:MAG: hypothetical protein II915_00710, partial [Eubacterium sp.]|nr:hypothetical protein [Eubacterium sp.]
MKRISKKIISYVLVVAVLSTVCGSNRIQGRIFEEKVAKAAETSGRYVADILVSHKESKEEAEKELGEEYTVLDRDFNEGMSGHSWIGYTTTDDADMAIKDLKVMGMDGNYSESDYK